MNINNKATGALGEEIAASYLQSHGFFIIDHNWKIEFGEIDIIAIKNNITYFIEVKTQHENQQTSPIDELTPSKIRKLINLISLYSTSHQKIPQKFMLSAICVFLSNKKNDFRVNWIENLID